MNTEEQFAEWVKKENETAVLDWLKQATDKERRTLAPLIKKLRKHYEEFYTTDNRSYRSRGSDQQHHILRLASYICFSKADYLKDSQAHWIIDREQLNKVKDWYQPDWFSDLVNQEGEDEFMPANLDYAFTLQLEAEGLIRPSQKLIARTLIRYVYEQRRTGQQWWTAFVPEKLLERPETLRDHVWTLFQEETDIYMAGRYHFFGKDVNSTGFHWQPLLVQLAAEGKLDRKRLLRESLLASNKNFNKNLSGWFAEIATLLLPTKEELLELQPELFAVLNAPHSKPVNEALQKLKFIAQEKQFDSLSLIDAAPVVLCSKTKATVTAALMLLEQVAKSKPELQVPVATTCCQALVHADESLQTRAARIIVKYGQGQPEAVRESLQVYRDGLLQQAASLLEPFLPLAGNDETPDPGLLASPAPVAEYAPVTPVQNTDELLFLAAQAFDNNDPLHLDLLPEALIRLQEELKGSLLAQLQPALQRALQLTKSGLRSGQGQFDHMLAIFFIDICVILVRRYPEEAKELNAVFEKFNQQDGDIIRKWTAIDDGKYYTEGWGTHYKDPFYEPRKHWLRDVAHRFRTGDKTVLLSTPTHYPGLIDPLVLVNRILEYQEKDLLTDPMDLWMAIGRTDLRDTKAAVERANEKLKGEWRELFLFLFNPDAEPAVTPTQPEAWFMALLSKKPGRLPEGFRAWGYDEQQLRRYTGQFGWRTEMETYERDEYRWENGNMRTVKVMDNRKSLIVEAPAEPPGTASPGKVRGWLDKLTGKAKQPEKRKTPLLYDYYEIKAQFFSNEHNDIRRVLLMAPDNAEAFLPGLVRTCMRNFEYVGEGQKRIVCTALQFFHEHWDRPGEMAHLFVATSLIYPDKTAAQTAAEIWLQYAPSGAADSALIGKILARHASIEMAPLKRFNDLAQQSMFRVSAAHNRCLQSLAENLLSGLPATPVKHLKKLVELYKELYALNRVASIPETVRMKLGEWGMKEW